jgi:hypothetical protein
MSSTRCTVEQLARILLGLHQFRLGELYLPVNISAALTDSGVCINVSLFSNVNVNVNPDK